MALEPERCTHAAADARLLRTRRPGSDSIIIINIDHNHDHSHDHHKTFAPFRERARHRRRDSTGSAATEQSLLRGISDSARTISAADSTSGIYRMGSASFGDSARETDRLQEQVSEAP